MKENSMHLFFISSNVLNLIPKLEYFIHELPQKEERETPCLIRWAAYI